MQALCFAIEHPDFARNVVSMASTYATQPWAIAFNKIAMHAIKNDPEFKGGYYDEEQVAKLFMCYSIIYSLLILRSQPEAAYEVCLLRGRVGGDTGEERNGPALRDLNVFRCTQ